VDDDFVRVAEYYRIEEEEATAVQLSNGETGWEDKLVELPPGVTVVKKRKGTRCKVMWSKLTAVEELESPRSSRSGFRSSRSTATRSTSRAASPLGPHPPRQRPGADE
jgi:hypothetical protein